jgi:16S rRNA A1518/A1519 N6-dimethyltransferase RsmA/KsgA/DIM1 with predicted DNA glycosylase/AP lyase activity
VERVMNVSREAFRPPPDIMSTVIRVVPYVPPRIEPEAEDYLRVLTRVAFGQRRKQFQRILRDAYRLTPDDIAALESELAIDLRDRPETFDPDGFIALAKALRARGISTGG